MIASRDIGNLAASELRSVFVPLSREYPDTSGKFLQPASNFAISQPEKIRNGHERNSDCDEQEVVRDKVRKDH